MWIKRLFPTIVLLAGSFSGANAQAPAAPTPPTKADQRCAPSQSAPDQGTIAPREGAAGQKNGATLGDKLAQSDGVICPPSNVDPKMRAPAPNGGPMPVIPPPGSPGGDQTIRPK
ncbi:MAG: hypothetical protein ACTHNN_02040 [Xanthobacteraceae bacterium]